MKEIKTPILILSLLLLSLAAEAQETHLLSLEPQSCSADTISEAPFEKNSELAPDSAEQISLDTMLLPSTRKKIKYKRNGEQFVPNPQKALWLALVMPGAGQIYNRKYWKLPIIYGGFIGCTYALLWNQQMYNDYSQAYLDIMDDDPNTHSYTNMLPMGYDITGREEQFKKIFRHKRDYYRKYRDMSIFAFFGVYLVSVVDAYVDAQLSTFDISKDLSLSLRPKALRHDHMLGESRHSQAVGVACALRF